MYVALIVKNITILRNNYKSNVFVGRLAYMKDNLFSIALKNIVYKISNSEIYNYNEVLIF